ncbi:MAG TPA: hypothetical protein VLL48_07195, partial [Longimicrobiales bacterium]|nr:hypothetical protein [Longimicrobiales bacterium]
MQEPAGGPAEDPEEEPAAADEVFRALEGRTFRRSIVLVGSAEDSLLVVPWLVSARVHAGGVDRTARGLVLRGSTWEPVYGATWEDPPTRAPWRILPHREMRVVVGMDDGLERIVHDDGSRILELALGDVLTEWTGPRGGTFRLLEGSVRLGGRAVGGLMLDMSRSVGTDEPGYGDWAFLVSGDSLQVVLHD